jgi:hypothetical protein
VITLPLRSPVVDVQSGIITLAWSKALGQVNIALNNLPDQKTGTHAQRSGTSASGLDNTLFFETDRMVWYVSYGGVWRYAAGYMRSDVANEPTDLGVDDTGFLFGALDYGHLFRWTGMAWEFAPGDPGNGYYATFAVAPTQAGWVLCNGANTDYLTVGMARLGVHAFALPTVANEYFRR